MLFCQPYYPLPVSPLYVLVTLRNVVAYHNTVQSAKRF